MQAEVVYGNKTPGDMTVAAMEKYLFAPGSPARFIFAISTVLSTTMSQNTAFIGILLALSILAFLAWGGGINGLGKVAKYIVWLLAFLFVLHLFMHNGKPIFSIWFLHATVEGAKAGLLYGLRLAVFAYAAYIIFSTTDPFELISPVERLARLLGRHGRLLSSFALAFYLALRFIPELSEQGRMTMLAFKSKGLDLRGGLRRKARVVTLFLPPLFVSALKRSEITAAALNVKGYGTRYSRAVLPPLRFNLGDFVTISISIAIFIAGWRIK